jgi:hypothetical protein
VLVGHGVMFTNDPFPQTAREDGLPAGHGVMIGAGTVAGVPARVLGDVGSR